MEETEWEAIQHPDSGYTITTQSDEKDVNLVVVATPTEFNEPSIFPPSNHDGLPVTPPQGHRFHQPKRAPSSPLSSYSSSLSPSSSQVDESELPNGPYQPQAGSSGLKACLGILSSGALRVAYGIRCRIGIWSIATVAAVLLVVAYGRRWRRWRRRSQKESLHQLMLLIDQKEEKIQQLLIQIDQINKILSARKSVPVNRIVVDPPLVNKQRLNWKPT